jgi:calcineurin-like phosphoesterase family protein
VAIWFASDHHFGHENIRHYEARLRGHFASTEQMNDAILELHNSLVAPADTVYLLGDLAMGDFTRSMSWAERLNGHKLLIAGNHDKHSSAYERREHKREERAQIYRDHGFETLSEIVETEIGGRRVVLSHYPYRGTEDADTTGEERYAALRPVNEGLPLIHGHVHSLWRSRGRMLNVGIDANDLRPTSEAEVVDWIDTRAVHE